MIYQIIVTPCGPLRLALDEGALARVDFMDSGTLTPDDWHQDPAALAPFVEQFTAYFAGRLQRFELPLCLTGTPFQQRVWQALAGIPYGQTRSYGEQAASIGKPTAVRAVGAANGRNPLPIILPCHRVIGRDGSLTGYAGGLARKAWLLEHEQKTNKIKYI